MVKSEGGGTGGRDAKEEKSNGNNGELIDESKGRRGWKRAGLSRAWERLDR